MCIEKYAILTLIYYIMQWACYKKASAYGSRVSWTPARRIRYDDDAVVAAAVVISKPYHSTA